MRIRQFNAGALVGGLLSVAIAPPVSAQSALPGPLEAGWNGKPVCEKLHEDTEYRVLRCTFPPNVGHERHFHSRNFGYVVAGGRMRITDASGTVEKELVAGTSSESAGVEWHEVLNIGSTTVVYLMFEPK